MDQLERISEMETCLSRAETVIRTLLRSLEDYADVQEQVRALSDYYGSEEWNRDLDDDRAGRLPGNLRRGVLSEDGIYNLLIDNRNAVERMLEITMDHVRSERI